VLAEMRHQGVLGFLFPLRHQLDQQVNLPKVRIPLDEGLCLLLLQGDELPDCRKKLVEQALAFPAKRDFRQTRYFLVFGHVRPNAPADRALSCKLRRATRKEAPAPPS
jgi:hypothetical protein